jgi:hypothetical protein
MSTDHQTLDDHHARLFVPRADPPDPAALLRALECAIDVLVLANHALAVHLGPDCPPATVSAPIGMAHYWVDARPATEGMPAIEGHAGPEFGIWLRWRAVENLDAAWQAWRAATGTDLNVNRRGTTS